MNPKKFPKFTSLYKSQTLRKLRGTHSERNPFATIQTDLYKTMLLILSRPVCSYIFSSLLRPSVFLYFLLFVAPETIQAIQATFHVTLRKVYEICFTNPFVLSSSWLSALGLDCIPAIILWSESLTLCVCVCV